MVKQSKATFSWGIAQDKWREIGAFCFLSMAVLLLLALISHNSGGQWIGSVGLHVAQASHFLMGRWVAYVLPFLLILAAFHALKGLTPFNPLRKAVSAALILVSLCALLTLSPLSNADRESAAMAFDSGGLLGNFLTSESGLGLARLCGPAGV